MNQAAKSQPLDDETTDTDSDVPTEPTTKRIRGFNRRIENSKNRNQGKSYETQNKTKKVEAKSLKPPCGNQCKLKCSSRISEEKRLEIFKTYWNLGDLHKQRKFIKDSTEIVQTAYPRVTPNKTRDRGQNLAYYFTINDQEKQRVCKNFFMATLDINNRIIQTVRKKTDPKTGILMPDLRGRIQPTNTNNTLSAELVNSVHEHIQSIPVIPSDNIKDTNKKFIDGGKTIAELHRDYVNKQESKAKQVANYFQYRKIFNTYNYGFLQPKKDEREDCTSFNIISKEAIKYYYYSLLALKRLEDKEQKKKKKTNK